MKSDSDLSQRDQTNEIHPPIRSLLDALTFRLARLVAVNDLSGTTRLRNNFGLSLNEWRVLGLTHALGPVGFGRIRRLLLMDKGQLSRTAKALTERGLLTTQPSPDDARAVELVLTKEGETLHDEVLSFTAARNEVVVATLTPEECREFLRLLQKITAHNEELSALAEALT